MGLTLAQKILLKASGQKELTDFVYAKVDFCFGNDITAPLAVKEFEKAGFNSVFDKNKIGFICDHFTPSRDAKAANNVALLKNFAHKYKIKHFYDIQHCGVEHAFLPEAGIVKPYDLVIGADSHTCTYGALAAFSTGVGSSDLAAAMSEGKVWLRVPETMRFIYKGKLNKWLTGKDLMLNTIGRIGVDGALYKVMQFSGEAISQLDMDARFAMCNMAIEAGGKAGMVEPDFKTIAYAKAANPKLKNLKIITSDKDAVYSDTLEIDVSKMEPQVACPHLPSNVKPVSELSSIKVDQVVIGSCTNGRLSDIEISAKILKGKKVKKGVRAIVFPATYKIYNQAEQKGYLKTLLDSGFVISSPTCGPCLGGHAGILAKGETAIATTNRNFIGRMGHPESFVYLSSPAVAAASAITGTITHPQKVVKVR